MKKQTTRILVECAMMIALGLVLSLIKVFHMPQGGSVTCASMVPLVLVSYRHGLKWGVGTAFTFSLVQMLLQFYAPPAGTLWAFLGTVALDYVVAYTALGAAALFGRPFKKRRLSVAAGALVVSLIRYACSFLSGILIWAAYAPEGTPVWIYSLVYNGSYMVPEIIITVVVAVLLIPVLDRIGPKDRKA